MMAGLLTYQVITVVRMKKIITGLSEVSFQTADMALQMQRDLALVEFFAQKFFVTGDHRYSERLEENRTSFASDLARVEQFGLTNAEQEEIKKLSNDWSVFCEELEQEKKLIAQAQGAQEEPDALYDQLGLLRIQTESIYRSARNGIAVQVSAFKQAGRDAERVSWVLASIALLLGALVSFLIVQSITSPLKQLTQGTRAITEGKFFYRLDTSRRDEFGQLAKDFNTMTHRLDELDQMKKDFVAHVSHELKVPLASMQETIQLLLEEISGPLSEKQRRLLELNLASGRRLSSLISNLLDLSRMEAGVMEYELKSNDLAGLARTAAAELQSYAHERDLSIVVETPAQPVKAACDGDRVLQVLRNLIGNAVKFSPKGKAIRVHVATSPDLPPGLPGSLRGKIRATPDGMGFALVTVADAGPGVPDEHKEKIFEKFHQVKQGKKLPGQGAGLGLAICRTIAEAHRGAIWVEDNPEGGSVFVFLLSPGENDGQVTYSSSSPI